MLFSCEKHTPLVCPKTDKPIEQKSKFRHLRWLFPITGLAALVWFLIRVIPKPSRATYPCQRVAFPLASGFIVWLLGLAGSTVAYHKAKRSFARARYVLAAICIIASVAFVWAAMSSTEQEIIYAHEPPVANDPLGEGRGVHPGRVAWIHDANSTDWVYTNPSQSEHWYEDEHTDQQVVNEMLSKTLRSMTGKGNDYDAWDAIFRNFNQRTGKGNVGYTPGEKIGIKINHTLSTNADPCTMDKTPPWGNYMNFIDNSPQLTIALLRQLIDNAGVAPGDISIGDPGRITPNYWYDMVEPNCPGVVYIAAVGGMGRTESQWSGTVFDWSDPCSARTTGVVAIDYVPVCFAEADYFINFPVLKSHSRGGITVCGKNHYGSLIRNPDGSIKYERSYPGPWSQNDYYDMHDTLPDTISGMGKYRCLVDLMGHPQLGGKTMLCLVDALFAGQNWDSVPAKWQMEPFNNDWPSSIFLSMDQVAADSVAFDFLYEEWGSSYPGMSGADDYLHEAALIPSPPSGVNYDPNNDGGLTESLGVHEHWNDANNKQYSRNLDPVNGTGIELVTETGLIGDFDDNNDVDFKDFAVLAAAWLSRPEDANWNAACDISMPSDSIIDEKDLMVFCENWLN